MTIYIRTTVTVDERKITANGATLNFISIMASKAAEKFHEEGCDALARQCEEYAEEIFRQLDEKGLYK